ncbi:probable protein phosphatase 2C 4 [Prosopis cineraria]|uniref:probable protein phosphatase 2C 4 n=1 Tax=Prosopis cineraria TaxID=364024 RepID=UPI002410210A|nr:probable protein phosphatase 2C 4 [Prosopis cineraria]XP_054815988.1 probable protein phosphatase 2C 4 [Prosopis cineraria]XP_054815989.1 probable protein phosphatase 2C 4 [Prosopis cineraria]
MGNGICKLTVCFTGGGSRRRKQDISYLITQPLDEGLGHSFCYVRPDPTRLSLSKVHCEETTTFRTISGASVSANTSTPLSTAFVDLYSYGCIDRAAAFESSTSFASLPLQPIPRTLMNSGPFSGNLGLIPGSGPLERGFMSGPIERGFMSGPIDRGLFSGPMERGSSDQFQRSYSHGGYAFRPRTRKSRWIRVLQRAISKTLSQGQHSIVPSIKGIKEPEWIIEPERHNENLMVSSVNFSSDGSLEDDESMESQNLQWAQGKAGEDRVHVVVSEEHGWVFVGIYDGFNGPDAPDYLLSNLYGAVHKELKGLLWDDGSESSNGTPDTSGLPANISNFEVGQSLQSSDSDVGKDRMVNACSQCVEQEGDVCTSGDANIDKRRQGKNCKSKYRGATKKWEENQRRWKCEWDRERVELDKRLKEQLNRSGSDDCTNPINHSDVLEALSEALRKTEESYLEIADKMVLENPELALMGSCVLVMLMKGEDVYVMNVGDSRAVLGQKAEPDYWLGKIKQDLERINEETMHDLERLDDDRSNLVPSLSAFQLTKDHCTNVEEEVQRIQREHPDDACAVLNDRVKGSLKVTRAFGAGYLKQAKWNNALLETFRIDYVGTSPYITCRPYLKHHRLGPKDKFLILSSDGLYQYLTNEEAVAEVELFITLQPEGDPAQHLVEEVLFRAAKKAGLDFHELLEIPQGDRRRYHDDVSIIVISLEGRIWRSCV